MASKIQTKADTNTKSIRTISQLAHNKNCFDCGQKGPTYVDDTIGAFVCTGCSGILRGLNPPHRIKSISMGTFSDDEVKYIQLRGNAFCRKVWLWNYDPQIGPRPPEVRDDQKMKDFLALKYEKKKWFNPVHDTLIADQLKQQPDAGSLGSVKGTDSESSLSRRTSTNSQRSYRSDASPTAAAKSNGVNQHQAGGSSGSISLPRSHTSSSVNQATSDRSSSAASDDIFGAFGGLSVSSGTAPPPTNPSPHTYTHLANTNASPVVSQEWASFSRSQTTPLFPPSSHNNNPPVAGPQQNLHANQSQNRLGPSQPVPYSGNISSEPQKPLQPTTKYPLNKTPVSPAKPIANANSDKYAALAELDEMFNGASPGTQKPSLPDPQTFLATSPPGAYGRGIPQQQQQASFPWTAPQFGQSFQGTASPQNGFWTDTINQPNASSLDPSHVWGQMPAYNGGGASAGPTNPFLGGGTAAPHHGHGAGSSPRHHPPGTYNTNPFL